ncbi:MAG: hypothetical protein ACFFC7_16005 [Candidatus Hermodarchaeota archaeon]
MSLRNCNLTDPPEGLGKLTALEILNLKGNAIENIPLVLQNLSHIENLNVYIDHPVNISNRDHQVLENLEGAMGKPLLPLSDETIYDTKKWGYQVEENLIVRLNLTNCALTGLSEGIVTGIVKLNGLRILDLRENKIKDIPTVIKTLKRHNCNLER